MLTASYGQLSTEQKVTIHAYLTEELQVRGDGEEGGDTEQQTELGEFVQVLTLPRY